MTADLDPGKHRVIRRNLDRLFLSRRPSRAETEPEEGMWYISRVESGLSVGAKYLLMAEVRA